VEGKIKGGVHTYGLTHCLHSYDFSGFIGVIGVHTKLKTFPNLLKPQFSYRVFAGIIGYEILTSAATTRQYSLYPMVAPK